MSGGPGCRSSRRSRAQAALVRPTAIRLRQAPGRALPATPASWAKARNRRTGRSGRSRSRSHPTGHRSWVHLLLRAPSPVSPSAARPTPACKATAEMDEHLPAAMAIVGPACPAAVKPSDTTGIAEQRTLLRAAFSPVPQKPSRLRGVWPHLHVSLVLSSFDRRCVVGLGVEPRQHLRKGAVPAHSCG